MRSKWYLGMFVTLCLACSISANATLIRADASGEVDDLSTETGVVFEVDADRLLGAFNVDVGGTL